MMPFKAWLDKDDASKFWNRKPDGRQEYINLSQLQDMVERMKLKDMGNLGTLKRHERTYNIALTDLLEKLTTSYCNGTKNDSSNRKK